MGIDGDTFNLRRRLRDGNLDVGTPREALKYLYLGGLRELFGKDILMEDK